MYWEILGIEPTTDIKKIKTAYAALAKKYNPEEHPEEFKRIYSAYKAACAYAKRFPVEKNDGGKQASAENVSAGEENRQEYSFSAVAPGAKGENAPEQASDNHGQKFTFPETSGAAHRKDTENEPAEEAGGFSFDSVDTTAKGEKISEPVTDKEGFDFTNISAEGKTDEPCTETEADSGEKYDFSGIKADLNSDTDGYSEVQKRRKLLGRLRKILSTPETADNEAKWREFFDLPEFEDMREDYDFRCGVCEAFYGKFFGKKTAHIIAEGFGYGSRAVPTDYYCNRWQVAITVRTSPAASKKPKPHKSGYKLRNGLVIGFIVLSVILRAYIRLEGSSSDGYTPSETAAREVYSDSDELQEALFEMLAESSAKRYSKVVGKWRFSFGTIEFYSDNTFEMINDKGVFTGTAASVPSEYPETIKITLSDSDSDINGTYVILRDFEDGRKYAIYYNHEGNMTGPGTIEE
ncbi:MAG: DnaJ domain-containing protein [Oscillospiraceae bacterium]